MITPGEEEFIVGQAYVPEHLPGYGAALSQGEPFLVEDFLCYGGNGFLILVGYPLKEPFDEDRLKGTLRSCIQRFKPAQVALMAPSIPLRGGSPSPLDSYYKLDLTNLRIPAKVRNMVRRGGKQLNLEEGRELKEEHRKLIQDFLAFHPVDGQTRRVFERIPAYLSSAPSARLFQVRDSGGKLVAFDIAEFGARDYAFYLFNFRSPHFRVPGASDLLLYAIIIEAQRQGKSSVNLGLGINPKVAFFKKKWGGVPFLKHQFLLYRPSPPSFLDSLLQGFLKEC